MKEGDYVSIKDSKIPVFPHLDEKTNKGQIIKILYCEEPKNTICKVFFKKINAYYYIYEWYLFPFNNGQLELF
jgi:hypothetical protein